MQKENNETPPKKEINLVFGLFFPTKSEKQLAISVGWLPAMAMTGNGANDTPVQSQVERDKTVATNEDSR